jgi:hypothetical protein
MVINGALPTHPVTGSQGRDGANRFCDPTITGVTRSAPIEGLEKSSHRSIVRSLFP